MTKLEIFEELIKTHKGTVVEFLICFFSFWIELFLTKITFRHQLYLTCFVLVNGIVITLKILITIINKFTRYLEEIKEREKILENT